MRQAGSQWQPESTELDETAGLRFRFDGRGDTWSAPYPLVPLSGDKSQADSRDHSDLLPLGKTSFLIVDSWFKRIGPDGLPHKSVLVRRVEVK